MCKESETASCLCRQAVEKTYRILTMTGEPERVALDIAKRVYKHHHPEHSRRDAALTVERWVARQIH